MQPRTDHRNWAAVTIVGGVGDETIMTANRAHRAGELAGDGEAQSGSAEALRRRGVGLGEFLEQLRLLLGCHADAGVGDGTVRSNDRRRSPCAAQPHHALLSTQSRMRLQALGLISGWRALRNGNILGGAISPYH